MNEEQLQKLVMRLATDCMEAHRGAFWWDEELRVAVAFGNDGKPLDEGEVDFEIAAIRRLLTRFGGKALAFAFDAEGITWALACDLSGTSLNPGVLEGVLWKAYCAGATGRDYEPEPFVLTWNDLKELRRRDDVESVYTGSEVHVARTILERNGLL